MAVPCEVLNLIGIDSVIPFLYTLEYPLVSAVSKLLMHTGDDFERLMYWYNLEGATLFCCLAMESAVDQVVILERMVPLAKLSVFLL